MKLAVFGAFAYLAQSLPLAVAPTGAASAMVPAEESSVLAQTQQPHGGAHQSQDKSKAASGKEHGKSKAYSYGWYGHGHPGNSGNSSSGHSSSGHSSSGHSSSGHSSSGHSSSGHSSSGHSGLSGHDAKMKDFQDAEMDIDDDLDQDADKEKNTAADKKHGKSAHSSSSCRSENEKCDNCCGCKKKKKHHGHIQGDTHKISLEPCKYNSVFQSLGKDTIDAINTLKALGGIDGCMLNDLALEKKQCCCWGVPLGDRLLQLAGHLNTSKSQESGNTLAQTAAVREVHPMGSKFADEAVNHKNFPNLYKLVSDQQASQNNEPVQMMKNLGNAAVKGMSNVLGKAIGGMKLAQCDSEGEEIEKAETWLSQISSQSKTASTLDEMLQAELAQLGINIPQDFGGAAKICQAQVETDTCNCPPGARPIEFAF